MYTVYKQKWFGSLLRSWNETSRKIQNEKGFMRRFTCYPAQWQWQMKIIRDPTKHVRILTRTGSLPGRNHLGLRECQFEILICLGICSNILCHCPLPNNWLQLILVRFPSPLPLPHGMDLIKYQNGCDVEHPEAPQTDNLARNYTSIPLAHVISSPNMIKLTCSNKIPAYIAYSWCKTQTSILGIINHLCCPKLFVKEKPFLMKHNKGCGPQKNLEKSIILTFPR